MMREYMNRILGLSRLTEVAALNNPLPRWQIPIRLVVRKLRCAVHKLRLGDKLSLGNNVNFGRRSNFRPPQFMHLGDNVYFGQEVLVETNLKVGSDVLISSRVAFLGHEYDLGEPGENIEPSRSMSDQAMINIEGDNIIGFGTRILGNVTIGRGCVVGVGSLVTTDLPRYTVCTGVPARPVRRRFKPWRNPPPA